jgi:hypothetical protein
VLFARLETELVRDGGNGRSKARVRGEGVRVMYTESRPAFEAVELARVVDHGGPESSVAAERLHPLTMSCAGKFQTGDPDLTAALYCRTPFTQDRRLRRLHS